MQKQHRVFLKKIQYKRLFCNHRATVKNCVGNEAINGTIELNNNVLKYLKIPLVKARIKFAFFFFITLNNNLIIVKVFLFLDFSNKNFYRSSVI